jgi:hypothetical protein
MVSIYLTDEVKRSADLATRLSLLIYLIEKHIMENFKLAHKEYCKIFNKFLSSMNRKFKKDTLSNEDKIKINKWLDEYIQQLHYTTLVFSDMESQVDFNQTLDITTERQQDSEILEKVKSIVAPLSLLYFIKFYEAA